MSNFHIVLRDFFESIWPNFQPRVRFIVIHQSGRIDAFEREGDRTERLTVVLEPPGLSADLEKLRGDAVTSFTEITNEVR